MDHGNDVVSLDLNLGRNRLFPCSHVPSQYHAYQKAVSDQKAVVNVDHPGTHRGHVRDMTTGSEEEVGPVIRDIETAHGKILRHGILNHGIHGAGDIAVERNFHAQVAC